MFRRSLSEIGKLFKLGRIDIGLSDPGLGEFLSSVTIWDVTAEVCRAASGLDFRSDPADELIAATSVHGVPLLTRDRKLRASQVVPLAIR